jgi:HEPN domain-containing protein
LSQPELDEARLLLRKAREDADAVRKLFDDSEIADSVVGFHAQQAVEKAIKAVLAVLGDAFPWTHDLRHLMERLDAAGTPLPTSLYDIRELGPWAVEFRYGETIDDSLDRGHAYRLVSEVIAWSETWVQAPGRTQRITGGDREAGIVRVPQASKQHLPSERTTVNLVLRGSKLGLVRWDPRLGPDRERSGVLRVGREAAAALSEGTVLRITAADGAISLD